MLTTDIKEASARAIDLALHLLEANTPSHRTYKTDRDFATDTDFLIETEVRQLLKVLTPDIGFLGEEQGASGPTSGPRWCLDPIDGTTNYARGIPNYGVSLALLDNEQPIHGEIALPRHLERYVTIGGRAYLNGQLIHVSNITDTSEAVVSVGDFATGPDSVFKNRERLASLSQIANQVARVRMLGSAATDLAWLAAGRIDAVVMHSNHPWDVAAGVAIAKAAGATVVGSPEGVSYTVSSTRMLAFSPALGPSLFPGAAT